MTVHVSEQKSAALVPVFIVDLETLTCIEANASNFERGGCRIVSDKVGELREMIGLRLNGLDKMIRARITSQSSGEALVSFMFDDKPQGEKRAERRREVNIPVQVYDQQRTISMHCRIVDASKSGCRLEGPCLEALPEDISLRIRGMGVPVDGELVWCRNGYAGVRLLWQFSSSQDVGDLKRAGGPGVRRVPGDGTTPTGHTPHEDGPGIGGVSKRKRRARGGAFGTR